MYMCICIYMQTSIYVEFRLWMYSYIHSYTCTKFILSISKSKELVCL